jgi:hypothetical protein
MVNNEPEGIFTMQGASAAAILRHKVPHRALSRGNEAKHVDIWALALVAIIAVICGMVVGMLTLWVRAAQEPVYDIARVKVAGRIISLPASWIPETSMTGSARDRLDLLVPLNDLGIAGAGDARMSVTVAASDSSMHPAERPSRLYARFVSADYSTGPGGLIRRKFREEAAFQGETLYLSSPDGRLFSARCQEIDSIRPTCFSEFRVGTLDIRATYTIDTLAHWSLMTETLTQRFAGADLRL